METFSPMLSYKNDYRLSIPSPSSSDVILAIEDQKAIMWMKLALWIKLPTLLLKLDLSVMIIPILIQPLVVLTLNHLVVVLVLIIHPVGIRTTFSIKLVLHNTHICLLSFLAMSPNSRNLLPFSRLQKIRIGLKLWHTRDSSFRR